MFFFFLTFHKIVIFLLFYYYKYYSLQSFQPHLMTIGFVYFNFSSFEHHNEWINNFTITLKKLSTKNNKTNNNLNILYNVYLRLIFHYPNFCLLFNFSVKSYSLEIIIYFYKIYIFQLYKKAIFWPFFKNLINNINMALILIFLSIKISSRYTNIKIPKFFD